MVQQVDEIGSTTAAQHPDPTEVLIEQVRRQARRRRRRNLALVVVALAAGSAAYFVASGRRASPPRSSSTPFAGHGIPASLASAVNKTLGVRSVEIVTNFEPGPAIYQAPDGYADSEDFGTKTDPLRATYYIFGDAMFFAHYAYYPDGVRVLQIDDRLGKVEGLPAARGTAFAELLSTIRMGSDFVHISADVFTFHIRNFDDGAFLFSEPAPGEITVSGGYVASVTIRAPHTEIEVDSNVPDIVVGTLTTRYEHIDDAPHLVAPVNDALMCRPAGSIVLQRCRSGEASVLP